MILDTSALIAILRDEPDASGVARAIESADQVKISAATVLEASLVCGPARWADLDELLTSSGAVVQPVDSEAVRLAREAHARFGRGSGSAARLNFGDLFSYALAMSSQEELLYVGHDFGHTDVRRAGQ